MNCDNCGQVSFEGEELECGHFLCRKCCESVLVHKEIWALCGKKKTVCRVCDGCCWKADGCVAVTAAAEVAEQLCGNELESVDFNKMEEDALRELHDTFEKMHEMLDAMEAKTMEEIDKSAAICEGVASRSGLVVSVMDMAVNELAFSLENAKVMLVMPPEEIVEDVERSVDCIVCAGNSNAINDELAFKMKFCCDSYDPNVIEEDLAAFVDDFLDRTGEETSGEEDFELGKILLQMEKYTEALKWFIASDDKGFEIHYKEFKEKGETEIAERIKNNTAMRLDRCYNWCFPTSDNIIANDPRFKKCEERLAALD